MLKKFLLALVITASTAGFALGQHHHEDARLEATPVVAPADTPEAANNTVCPVTGLPIGEPGKYTVEHNGKIYNLCCQMCAEKFLEDPETCISRLKPSEDQE
ncbi:MAG: TRASH domain-containing protein [Candidatus Omnitrophota bacterium]